ncbi:hypothetical protein [Paraburkholderia fynbosensis]|uniref:Uncharacterized protein n=1 Tax=Paraburkholderia fynbosensis TaxID=1200993 RepID=A0A6J5FJW3_9BURK|nr:hypothetical protein [Paraburkholderia fynbosensis]CAB3781969.1 hypothetical protein LMG27177_01132 [Paraburkholderia fynbosensis]
MDQPNTKNALSDLQTALEETVIFTIPPHYERWQDGFKSLDKARTKVAEIKVKLEHAESAPLWLMSDLARVQGRLNDFVRLRDDFYNQYPNGGDSDNWRSLHEAERSLTELQRDVDRLKNDIRAYMSGSRTAPPTNREKQDSNNIGLLDSLIILFASTACTLLLFWMAANVVHVPLFETLPTWVSGGFTSIWATVSASAAGIGAAVIRAFDKTAPRPNYLVWILGTTILLVLLIVGLGKLIPPSPPTSKTGIDSPPPLTAPTPTQSLASTSNVGESVGVSPASSSPAIPETHSFTQTELRAPVGNDSAHQAQMDICFRANPDRQSLPDHCDESGQRHAQNTFCNAKGYRESTGEILTMFFDGPTMTIGSGDRCAAGGCKTFQQITCIK